VKGHGEKLTRKQEKAIAALLLKPTIADAAKEAGIGETTLWRWLQLEEFQNAFKDAKRKTVEQAIAQLVQVSSEAVKTLSDIMQDKTAPASARVSAAKAVLEMTFRADEREQLIERIEELEKLVNKGGAA